MKIEIYYFSVANGPLCSHYSSGTKHAFIVLTQSTTYFIHTYMVFDQTTNVKYYS